MDGATRHRCRGDIFHLALGLSQADIGGGSEKLVPITFVVIVGTALLYGLTGAPVAKALGVAKTGSGGVLVAGGTQVARALALSLKDRGVDVVMWVGGGEASRAARDEGLAVYEGDPTAAASTDPPPVLEDVEQVVVASDDDGFNAMLSADLGEYYGRGQVHQLSPGERDDGGFYVRGQVLFSDSATYDELEDRLRRGIRISGIEVDSEGRVELDPDSIPMFVMRAGEELRPVIAGKDPDLEPGDELILLGDA